MKRLFEKLRVVHRTELHMWPGWPVCEWEYKCLDIGQRWFVVNGNVVLSGHRTRERARKASRAAL